MTEGIAAGTPLNMIATAFHLTDDFDQAASLAARIMINITEGIAWGKPLNMVATAFSLTNDSDPTASLAAKITQRISAIRPLNMRATASPPTSGIMDSTTSVAARKKANRKKSILASTLVFTEATASSLIATVYFWQGASRYVRDVRVRLILLNKNTTSAFLLLEVGR